MGKYRKGMRGIKMKKGMILGISLACLSAISFQHTQAFESKTVLQQAEPSVQSYEPITFTEVNEPIKANVSYSTHVQNIGWQSYVSNGSLAGTTGRALRLEGVKVNLALQGISGGIQYRTHIQNIGWQNWKNSNELSGTSGQALRLEAIELRLTGDLAKEFDVIYRVHAQNFGWLGWARNGQSSGTASYGYRLEGLEIKLVPKGASLPSSTQVAFKEPSVTVKPPVTNVNPIINYSTHIQNIGWQQAVVNGATSGTSGKALRLEGIKIGLSQATGNVQYRTHIQNIGWQDWKNNNELSGTHNQAKRLEAIEIKLTGSLANQYDVMYRVHAQNFGWLGWAKNGQSAGSAGYGYRLEAIQIKLVKKGTSIDQSKPAFKQVGSTTISKPVTEVSTHSNTQAAKVQSSVVNYNINTNPSTAAHQGLEAEALVFGDKVAGLTIKANVDFKVANSESPASQYQKAKQANLTNHVYLAKGTYNLSIPVGLNDTTVNYLNQTIDVNLLNREFLTLVNAERAKKGLKSLSYGEHLIVGTKVRAQELANIRSIAVNGKGHLRPDGSSYRTAFSQVPNPQYRLGENLAQNNYLGNPYQAISEKYLAELFYQQLANSPGHYANMMSPNYKYHAVQVQFSKMSTSQYYYNQVICVQILDAG